MSSSHTQSRVLQWIGIILFLLVIGGAYWYFQVRASTLNQSRNDLVTNGLVGLWSFNGDDISGTTAYDRSSTGANGTLTGGPTKTLGKVGQAIGFDGTDDYVSVTDNAALDFGDTSDFTISGWFYRDTFTTDDTVIAKRNGIVNTDDGYILYIDDATDQLILEVSEISGSDEYSLASASTFTTAGWNHFTVVWDQDSSENSEIFINGIDDTSARTEPIGGITAIGDLSNALTFQIGAESDNGNPFAGKLDEVRTYDRALSVTEIQSLYTQGGGAKVDSAVSQPQGVGRLDSGLAGYWTLDETTGSSAADASTNGNTGTLTNMENGDWTTGQISNGLTFDGTNEYINVPNSDALYGSSQIALATWVKIGSAPTNNGNIAERGGNSGYRVRINNNQTVSFLAVGVGPTTTATVVLDTWTHIVVVGSASGRKIYLNGVLSASSATVYSPVGNGSNLHIGADTVDGEYFNGSIDEFRFYNRVLSDDEIGQLYRLTTPTSVDTSLKGYWSFNGQDISGTTAYDRSGVGNTGTLTNGPNKGVGVIGQGLSFDGTDDRLDLGSYTTEQTVYTVASWVYQSGSSSGTILFRGSNDWCFYNPSITITSTSITVSESGCSSTGLIGTVPLSVVGWHHVGVTRSGSSVKVYIDGILVPTTGTPGTLFGTSSSKFVGGVSWGHSGSGYNNFLNTKIDEVRAYNRELSAGEIKALYDASVPDKGNSSASQSQGTGRLDSGLSGYWPLDENTGTSTADSSTNGNTGTLEGTIGTPTWVAGQIGYGLSFGTTNWMRVSDTDTLDVVDGTSFSLTGWFNRSSSTTDDTIIAKSNGQTASDTGYNMYIDDATDKVTFVANDGTDQYKMESVSTFTATGWHHVAVVWDENSAGQTKLYIDGVAQAATTTGTFSSVNSLANAVTFRVGAESDNGNNFAGSLDEARIYNRTLSADEVGRLYRLASPTGTDTSLKGYWSFNGQDMSGTTAYDRSGAGNAGTLSGPTKVPGKIGQGLSFDGTNDYVDVTDVAFAGAFTFSTWFYTTNNSQIGFIFGEDSSNSGGGAKIGIVSGNIFVRVVHAGSSDTTIAVPTVNQWHHLVVSRDDSNKVDLYVDGGSANRLFSDAAQADTFTFDIIGSAGDGSQNFSGKLDEARVYNRQLSADEVTALYNQSR